MRANIPGHGRADAHASQKKSPSAGERRKERRKDCRGRRPARVDVQKSVRHRVRHPRKARIEMRTACEGKGDMKEENMTEPAPSQRTRTESVPKRTAPENPHLSSMGKVARADPPTRKAVHRHRGEASAVVPAPPCALRVAGRWSPDAKGQTLDSTPASSAHSYALEQGRAPSVDGTNARQRAYPCACTHALAPLGPDSKIRAPTSPPQKERKATSAFIARPGRDEAGGKEGGGCALILE
ncbi:hypothetical protein B0H19DRAFT_1067226 [Mycena capillaripes]|nr:hypothetical protein B0H19DRAFT_1067226 [Mycena capillaripes]